MTASDVSLEALCRCLAFHIVESELTLQFSDENPDVTEKCAEGRRLIEQAGFNIDELYPVEDRPVGVAATAYGASPIGRAREAQQMSEDLLNRAAEKGGKA